MPLLTKLQITNIFLTFTSTAATMQHKAPAMGCQHLDGMATAARRGSDYSPWHKPAPANETSRTGATILSYPRKSAMTQRQQRPLLGQWFSSSRQQSAKGLRTLTYQLHNFPTLLQRGKHLYHKIHFLRNKKDIWYNQKYIFSKIVTIKYDLN